MNNERIKELAKEAGVLADYGEDIKEGRYQIGGSLKGMEKFAELIVAECMEVFSKDLPEEGDGKMLEVINRVCNVAEHFGVEE